ncbi:MAG: hypothetical protein K2Q18_17210, partial [Bdellovibrionales bacterium]|nr:hypothetical protein [Bdellovibrionales bacterium]
LYLEGQVIQWKNFLGKKIRIDLNSITKIEEVKFLIPLWLKITCTDQKVRLPLWFSDNNEVKKILYIKN